MEVDDAGDPGDVETSIKKLESEELKGIVSSIKERLKEEQNEISGKASFFDYYFFFFFCIFSFVNGNFFLALVKFCF